MDKLKYKPIKSNKNGLYFSKVKLGNDEVVLKTTNVIVDREIYKKDDGYYIDLIFENNYDIFLNKLKRKTTENFYSQFNQGGDLDFDDFETSYIDNYKVNGDEEKVYTIEVNKKSLFFTEDEQGNKSGCSYNDIQKGDNIDIQFLFYSVIFGQSEFSNKYIITRIKKNIYNDVNFDVCMMECSEEDNDEDEDDIMMNDNFLNKINNISDLGEHFSLMTLN